MEYVCEWEAAQDCYGKFSRCETQADGECGWTPTGELAQCLQNPDTYTGTALRPQFNDGSRQGMERTPWEK